MNYIIREHTLKMDCDVAELLAMTGVWHKITRSGAITGNEIGALVRISRMVGLRRRCAPRNDGGVAQDY